MLMSGVSSYIFQSKSKKHFLNKRVRKEIDKMMESDLMEPSKSPLACGVFMAKKKVLL